MNITLDHDPKLRYETNSISRKLFNLAFIPLLNSLPSQAKRFVRESHKSVKEVVDNVTTHTALEVLYSKGYKHSTNRIMQKLPHWIWFNTNNSKAVRNRILLVKRELVSVLKRFNERGENVLLLSIASGSARAVIEAIEEVKFVSGDRLSVTFLDKNPDALEYSRQLLSDRGLYVKDQYSWVNATAGSFVRGCHKNQYNLIEMVGLLDYFTDEYAINLFSSIREILRSGGVFITANINHNSEQRFLKRVVGWTMIYRSAEELGKLLLLSGFMEDEIKLYYEPLKVHAIAVVTKK